MNEVINSLQYHSSQPWSIWSNDVHRQFATTAAWTPTIYILSPWGQCTEFRTYPDALWFSTYESDLHLLRMTHKETPFIIG